MKNVIWVVICGVLCTSYVQSYDLTIVGPLIMEDGLGSLAIGFIDTLHCNFSINCITTHVGRWTDMPNGVTRELVKNPDKSPGNVSIFFGLVWDKNSTPARKVPESPIKLAYSMLESTMIPEQWVHVLNEQFDAVLVPDIWLVEVYEHAGVTVPIFVCPHGIYLEHFLQQPIKEKAHKPFTFGMTAGFWPRKNHLLLIEAFVQEFDDNPNVRLRVHGRNIISTLFPGEDLEAQIKKLIKEKKDLLHKYPHHIKNINNKFKMLKDKCVSTIKNKLEVMNKPSEYLITMDRIKKRVEELNMPNIEFINETFTGADYLEFMKSLDVHVGISQGEGFGIPHRQAMALGIPCIVSNNTSHKTICDTGLVYAVDAQVRNPAYYDVFHFVCGEQFNCTIDDVRRALREAYANYNTYLKHAQQARTWASQYDYNNEQVQLRYRTIVKPQNVVLTNYNAVENGIIYTNSERLYQKYKRLIENA